MENNNRTRLPKLLLSFILLTSVCTTGCQSVKRIFIKPPPEGVVENSYPLMAHAYQSSMVVKATPEELTDYISDLERLQDAASERGLFQIDIKGQENLKLDVGIGESVDIVVRMMGLKMPTKVLIMEYKLHEEIWLLVLTNGSWVLGRIEMNPVNDRETKVNVNVIGQTSDSLASLIDNLKLVETASQRIELWMSIIQAEFDPEVDVDELNMMGIRGEVYKELLQVHESSVWVDADPDYVWEWMRKQENGFIAFMPEIQLKESCPPLQEFWPMPDDEVFYCPAIFNFRSISIDMESFLTKKTKGNERMFRWYFKGAGQMGYLQMSVAPEAGGSRLTGMLAMEIPGPATPRIMDVMMTLTELPERLTEVIVDIKNGVEALV